MGIHLSGLVTRPESAHRDANAQRQWCPRYQPQAWHGEEHRDCGTEKKTPAEVNVAFAERLKATPLTMFDVEICVEAEEFWSDVGDTSNQRWTWYARERTSGTILAHHPAKRTDAACHKRMDKLARCPIR